jgi:2-C-methyl-D-erythritol 4-phosphate cytidylyltransferase
VNKIFVIAVILASGSSSRMQGKDKQFYKLVDGKEVITKTVSVFQNLKCIDNIILVTKEESVEKLQQIVNENKFSKVSKILSGGSTRQKSMINAYNYILKNTKFDNNYEYYILIHDGARPFIKSEIINECL